MNFTINFALFLMFAFANSTPVVKTSNNGLKPLEFLSIIELEEPCVRQGGICVRIDDCASDNLVQFRGVLCPQQTHLGIECCYIK